ncbi:MULTISPECIES: flagellar biosynthesis protein FlhB [unclassified Brevundimonas]|uniref:flagellar biosynthesis protein FlhB n=1 Tax=unclassified Brevundimonas TaxID=2622653 RepID=UPI000CFC42A6|nr:MULTISPECIES: flagellar biosynthesis protein FlhB [unclassified Brevundimonas]PRA28191.1 flagellar biosynthesis protein FlhB [Brevundimonas sp. MYb27]PQZ79664.1 flagellar biosynthesis protein FlhB [Brevundimonas sp. MYb31]PRB15401.1 flagellar biosynthesis protein FlhB [Brevundimonas sp. MYb52]PRB35678.1 flagellar biosynthesis protein FlhB [Brevundimonas sp. MYb46]PRB46359.1 flagellar biosynthesis protein FlhB [Brevundimonas sp. MYb33]
MAEGSDPESKTEEATPRKLEEARKKGDVAKSPDVAAAMSLAGATAVLLVGGGYFSRQMAEDMLPFLAEPHAMMGGLQAGAGVEIGMRAVWAVTPFLAALMLAVIIGGVGGNLAQSGFLFTTEKIKPKWSAVSPLSGFKRIFGPDGIVQFIKTFLKLVAIGAVCWWVLKPHTRELENLAAMSPALILPFARDLAAALMISALIFLAFTAGADFIWQKFRFAKRMRMTKEETKEDYKQTEGDPHIKGKLRQIRMQRSRQRMMQAVPGATVVITNPTHYSVALRYEPDQGDGAPICVAKGVDAVALRIRELAKESGVPVVENVPLARALYATVEVDEVIPREHFEAAAKVIGFVMQGRKRR